VSRATSAGIVALKEGNATKPFGRPKIVLSSSQIDDLERLAEIGATQEEQAAYLGISMDTLHRRMHDQPDVFLAVTRAGGRLKASLRRKQVSVALNDGHPSQATMLIWLGKTVLGQSDRVSLKIETTDDALKALKDIWPDIDPDEMIRQLTQPIDIEAEEVADEREVEEPAVVQDEAATEAPGAP